MTLRDYFAAKAMQAIIRSLNPTDFKKFSGQEIAERTARGAYNFADVMLKERAKETSK